MDLDGLKVVTAAVDVSEPKQLVELSDRVKSALHDAAVVLGTVREDGRPHLIANLTKSAAKRGLSAADIIGAAAAVVGGRGGGRDTMAQAGGTDAERLGEALEVARGAIEAKLRGGSAGT
jgi:alanyl-tRNA synthetase